MDDFLVFCQEFPSKPSNDKCWGYFEEFRIFATRWAQEFAKLHNLKSATYVG